MTEGTLTAETSTGIDLTIEASWKERLEGELAKPYFAGLKDFLKEEKAKGETVFPPGPLIFSAFNKTPFDAVKVVILGQDPYHGPGQAHGLCFSVQRGVRPPPSLVNMYKEMEADTAAFTGAPFARPDHGNLQAWAEQGVLLLNSSLTVRASQPGSHHGKGWEVFTNAAVKALNDSKEGLVFLLWGRPAQEKGATINPARHHVLKAAHPSPFSADRGFFGCRHFSQANALLAKSGRSPIDWRL